MKFTLKKGFHLFGTRSELFDEHHPIFGEAISWFHGSLASPLDRWLRREYPYEREVYIFTEFFGPNSFAGNHVAKEPKQLVVLDILFAERDEFLAPREFVRKIAPLVPTPHVVYEGKLNEELIAAVRRGDYPVSEGMVCKGTQRHKQYQGGIWMCKIKTRAYFALLKARFGDTWEQYAE